MPSPEITSSPDHLILKLDNGYNVGVEYKKGIKLQLTKNFWLHEFECKCKDPNCKVTIIDMDHVNKLQSKRDELQQPMTITCGYRCKKHNEEVGGATKSLHRTGQATDIAVLNKSPDEVAVQCEDFDGLGRYDTFTHIDSRGKKARWDFRKKK
jgi:uncharacterized protein YcbK (DUF882 family)